MTSATPMLFTGLIEQTRPSRFEEFWRIYPRKIAKRDAQKSYMKALQRLTPETDIIAGAMRYAMIVQNTEDRFIKHPSTWLNGDCWKDEGAPSAPSFMDIVRG